MKTCTQCGKSYSLSRVLCLDCCQILEENQYLRLVWVTLALAASFHLALGRFGYSGRGLLRESLMTEAFLLAICVLIWKSAQKWKAPQRRTLYELASLYSDRLGRMMVFGVAIFAVLSFSGVVELSSQKIDEPRALACFRAVRYYALLGFGLGYSLLVVLIQGLGLFDLRLKNSLIHQELKNRESDG